MASRKKSRQGLNRRSFVKLLPAMGVAGLTAPHLDLASVAAQAPQQGPQGQPPQRVTKEMLHAAAQLIGLELSDAHEALALPGVNNNLNSYEGLRKIDIPLDTEPAIAFHPSPPGKKYARKAEKMRLGKIEVPKYGVIEDLAFASAAQLGELIRARQITSLDLTKMYLARLKKYGPKLHCVITLTEELALEQAAKADQELKRGRHRGPLHGVPWGAKDLFATKGIRTTWGAEPYRNQVIDYDATVVERLRDAGAVLLAKLSMGALAQGDLWFEDRTRSPWNLEQGSSGSSAGSASATAGGLVGFALGTETLGSIVSPSSRCGVAGLRPTYGRISRYGAMGLSWTMDKIGPLCRSAEDCALVLAAIYGPDEKDITVEAVPFNWPLDAPLNKLRIGYLKTEFEPAPNPNNQQRPANEQQRQQAEQRLTMYKEALDVLRAAGADLKPIELPQFSTGNLRIILSAEAAAAFDDLTRSGGVNQLKGQERGDWPNTFRASRFIPAVEYLRAQRARALLIHQMDKLMAQWDVFVSPAPGSASLLITNLTGHPAVVAPCGFINNNPQAIMFTGGLYDEAAPLRVALAYEKATKWHSMHPKMDWA